MFEPDLDDDYYTSPPRTHEGTDLLSLLAGEEANWHTFTPAAQRAWHYIAQEIPEGWETFVGTVPILLALLRDTPTTATRLLECVRVDCVALYSHLQDNLARSLCQPPRTPEGVQTMPLFPIGALGLAPYVPLTGRGVSTGHLLIGYILYIWMRSESLVEATQDTVTKAFLIQYGIGLERVLETAQTLEKEGRLHPDTEEERPLYGVRELFQQIEASEIARLEVAGTLVTAARCIESLLHSLRRATGRGTPLQNQMDTLRVYFTTEKDTHGRSYAEKFHEWFDRAEGEQGYLSLPCNLSHPLDAYGRAFHQQLHSLLG